MDTGSILALHWHILAILFNPSSSLLLGILREVNIPIINLQTPHAAQVELVSSGPHVPWESGWVVDSTQIEICA